MRLSTQGDLGKVIRRAIAQGFRHVILSNNHHRFYAPDQKTIVQCSSSKGGRDDGWVHKFICEMRRAGYKTEQDEAREIMRMNGTGGGATTNLGEALKGALEQPAVTNGKHARGAFTEAIREYLRSEDEKTHSIAQVGLVIRARGFDYTDEQVGIVLSRLHTQAEVTRIGQGVYKWRHRHGGDAIGKTVYATAVAPAATGVAPSTASVADDYDEDERALDDALAALGRIEGVVRRHKAKMKRFRELKQLLSGEDL